MINRQLRCWVFMLYPDNDLHCQAIQYLDNVDNSLYIKHIEKKDEKGNILNKEHWHCVLRFDQPYWLSKLLLDLGLPEEDAHLFHSYRDFMIGKKQRFKSLNDYISYLDHMLEVNKPDKYSPDDFCGGLKKIALDIIASREQDHYLNLLDLIHFIRSYNLDHWVDCRYYTFSDWYNLCCKNGYGYLFYREWYKMRDILKPYIHE